MNCRRWGIQSLHNYKLTNILWNCSTMFKMQVTQICRTSAHLNSASLKCSFYNWSWFQPIANPPKLQNAVFFSATSFPSLVFPLSQLFWDFSWKCHNSIISNFLSLKKYMDLWELETIAFCYLHFTQHFYFCGIGVVVMLYNIVFSF